MIFSNTTPFIALCAIDWLDLMPALFGRVHVVDAVVRECSAGRVIPVPDLNTLDWVTIAPSANAERLLIDERIGRIVAERMGLKVTGTLGVLHRGRQQKLIPSFSEAAQAMCERGICFHAGLIERLARSIGE